MIIAGWNQPTLVIDAVREPVHFKHEAAEVDAVRRFKLPDGKDYTLPVGYRAVIEYDEFEARNMILQVVPIPT